MDLIPAKVTINQLHPETVEFLITTATLPVSDNQSQPLIHYLKNITIAAALTTPFFLILISILFLFGITAKLTLVYALCFSAVLVFLFHNVLFPSPPQDIAYGPFTHSLIISCNEIHLSKSIQISSDEITGIFLYNKILQKKQDITDLTYTTENFSLSHGVRAIKRQQRVHNTSKIAAMASISYEIGVITNTGSFSLCSGLDYATGEKLLSDIMRTLDLEKTMIEKKSIAPGISYMITS